ncbi:hypothetical protein ABIB27_002701 [Arthrobacter sp. UYEF21]
MRRTVLGILAAFFLLAGTACSITTEDPGYVAPLPLPPLEQLERAALVDPRGSGPARTSSRSSPRTGTSCAP